ncbi:Dynein heavy chain-like 15, partial [Homarus americanus]
MVFVYGVGEVRERARGSNYSSGMSDPKRDRDSDRDSLTGWTLIDREGTPEDSTGDGPQQDEDEDGSDSNVAPEGAGAVVVDEEEEDVDEEESGCGMEEEEDGGDEEALSDDLVSMGQRVQDIKGESVKASSGSDSSDIETLECPDSDDFYEDHALAYDSMHSSLFSSSLCSFTFVGGSDEGDVESLASTDISVLDAEKEKLVEEETDLSLASSPSLPDDLPAIKPDTQYRHTPDKDLNSRLNVVVALTLACVLGLGIGHFLGLMALSVDEESEGWSSRTVWQESLNSAQVRRLRELQDDLVSCMNTPLQASPHSAPEFSLDTSSASIMDQYQAEADSDNPNYQSASFIPVLTNGDDDGVLNDESFVESLIMPLEDAGVVLNPSRRNVDRSFVHGKPNGPKLTDPTFTIPDLMHDKPNLVADQHMEPVREIQEILNTIPDPYVSTNMETLAANDAEYSSSPLPVSSENVEVFLEVEETEPSFESLTSRDTNLLCERSSAVELPHLDQSLPSGCASSQSSEDLSGEVEEDLATVLPSSIVDELQVLEALNIENENLESEVIQLQQENIAPIKIRGKDGKYARDLRERINRLVVDNEELRLAIGKLQYANLPDGDPDAFTSAVEKNFNLRLAVGKLTHLGPDLNALRVSANDLQSENEELKIQVGKLRYQQQPLPQELNALARDLEKLKKTVEEASFKRNVLSAIQTLHEFDEGSFAEKIDVATDVFEDLIPGNVKLSSPVQQKLNVVRSKFSQIRASLSRKWEKLKELSHPRKIVAVGRDTLTKMNRVIVNVVNKMKEIGQVNIMKRGKVSVEKTISTLAEHLTALGSQFDKTWKDLEAEVVEETEDDPELMDEEDVGEDEEDPEEPEVLVAVPEEIEVTADEEEEKLMEEEDEEQVEDEEEVEEETVAEVEEETVAEEVEEETVAEEEEPKEEEDDDDDEEVVTEKVRGEILEGKEEPEKAVQEEDAASSGPSSAATMSQKGGNGGRRGGDKKKLPDDKKEKKIKKKKEKEEEKKHEGKRHRSRRNRLSEKEEKKEKKNAQKKENEEKESKEKQNKNNQENSKSRDKKNGNKDNEDKSRGHYQRNGKDRNIQEREENKRYYKGQYNKEYTGPKKAFIRRRGKNHTQHYNGDWVIKRATGREHKRKESNKADWLFERAKDRNNIRNREHKADWQFDRAQGRKDLRHDDYKKDRLQDHDTYGHTKYEKHETRRRYIK